jgi:NitT/TauT family transport system ATP-binding protein
MTADATTGAAVPSGRPGSPVLQFDQVGKIFPDGTEALRDVSFAVDKGQFVTVVGPSGCGKSTLLRLASGLDESTSGRCVVDRSNIGYVFQDATLLPWRTVRHNVELFAELHEMTRADMERAVTEVIELVGLSGFEQHYPRQLSGGMRMRVSLARSLVMEPPVFLFDEPFGALDEITRERLNEETLALFRREGFAGLFITHSIMEAVFMSTTVHVMSGRPGTIVASYDVPFDYPRDPELRFDPTFAELSGEINHALRGAHT